MLTATCHGEAVRVEVPCKPRNLTNCNCSICRRYGGDLGVLQSLRDSRERCAWCNERLLLM